MVDTARDPEAHFKIDTHEKVCAERYGNIWDALKDIKGELQTDRIANATAAGTMHDRFNTISNRMWAAVASVCGASVLGMFALVFHIMTRK